MRPVLADLLDLQPHPEGGWFRQTWASSTSVTLGDGRVRPVATLIHFLLPAGDSSAWHRVTSDELWLAHTGVVTLELGGVEPAPAPEERLLVGTDLAGGQLAPSARAGGGVAAHPAQPWRRPGELPRLPRLRLRRLRARVASNGVRGLTRGRCPSSPRWTVTGARPGVGRHRRRPPRPGHPRGRCGEPRTPCRAERSGWRAPGVRSRCRRPR